MLEQLPQFLIDEQLQPSSSLRPGDLQNLGDLGFGPRSVHALQQRSHLGEQFVRRRRCGRLDRSGCRFLPVFLHPRSFFEGSRAIVFTERECPPIRVTGFQGGLYIQALFQGLGSLRIRPCDCAHFPKPVQTLSVLAVGTDIDRNELHPFELLGRSGPRATFPIVGVDHQGCICRGVDQLVALHGMSYLEAGSRVVGAYQHQSPTHHRIAVLSSCHRLFETVAEHPRHAPACFQRSAHRGLIDASGAARYQRTLRGRCESPYLFGVRNQRITHVP